MTTKAIKGRTLQEWESAISKTELPKDFEAARQRLGFSERQAKVCFIVAKETPKVVHAERDGAAGHFRHVAQNLFERRLQLARHALDAAGQAIFAKGD